MKSVLVTGCDGGIGARICEALGAAGWRVIGVDKEPGLSTEPCRITADIGAFAAEPSGLAAFAENVRAHTDGAPLGAIVNNAAVQRLAPLEALAAEAIIETMNVNLVAPFLLIKAFLPELQQSKGVVLNIGSVHAQATKPEFSAYAASKAGLHGLTRALAVDLGPEVRVNTLAPAATATPMLLAGFEGRKEAFKALKDVHPLQRIATPEEIAKIAGFLLSEDAAFVSGETIYADGGVLSRLYDPA
ncbi:MAG: SDR family oxidoreductase [Pseudomonadota bacterium]